MKQNNKIEFHVPLIISLALVMAVDIPMLSLPFSESESSFMNNSITNLFLNEIGMVRNGEYVELPNLFDLLIYYICRYLTLDTLWLHAIAMIFSVLSILVAYKFGKFFFSVQAGVMASSVMCVQNVFLAQSGILSPIMLTNLCILWGMYFFFREKYGWCTLALCVAALTDTIGLAAAVFMLISYLRIKYREWSWKKNLMLSLPVIFWFAYETTSVLLCGKFSWRFHQLSLLNIVNNLYFIFVAQYRFVITAILILSLIINLMQKNGQYFVRDMGKNGTILFLLILAVNSLIGGIESWNLTPICILTIFTGCTISIMPVSYYTKYIIACVLICTSAAGMIDRADVSDSDVNYKTKIKVNQKTIEIIDQRASENESIRGNSNIANLFTLKFLGYNKNDANYKMQPLYTNDTIPCDWVIIEQGDSAQYCNKIRNNKNYDRLAIISSNGFQNEIYRKKR